MTDIPLNGTASHHALAELRQSKLYVANNLYIALKYLDAAQATIQAHTLPYPLGDTRAQLQSALDLVNKDISNQGNHP